MTLASKSFDVVIVGAGGAGMRAALQLAEAGINVALISKVFPTRSHTVSAQGGITAALANVDEDDWQWHMYDTVKGSDYLGDQDCIEYLCRNGPEVVYELEHMGLPFSRLEDGKIYQRPFGGQSKNFGGGQATRTCAAADRTGHALLHTLYQQNLRHKTNIFSEWYAIDLVKGVDGEFSGVVALCIESGELAFFHARVTLLATGGAGRVFQSTTNARINTGDGFGMVLRAGLPLQDMEMWQFHPTGIAGAGVLLTEGIRGEGGYLINRHGERFMERYAPHAKDLASRDVVARSMSLEMRAGNGFDPDGQDYLKLKLDHLGEEIINSRLPGIRELAITFAHADPVFEPIPVVPTCHYVMGGIPTNIHGQVISVDAEGRDKPLSSLYAVGECACVSVHGANRLGGNSLLDLVVFGRAAGIHIKQGLSSISLSAVSDSDLAFAIERYERWNHSTKGESILTIRDEMEKIMQLDFGVFRTEKYMQAGLNKLANLRERIKHAVLKDKSKIFNTARLDALQLENLLETAFATAACALNRQESRGAHSREDFPQRDDPNWLKHSLYFRDGRVSYRAVNKKPLTVEAFVPTERVY